MKYKIKKYLCVRAVFGMCNFTSDSIEEASNHQIYCGHHVQQVKEEVRGKEVEI